MTASFNVLVVCSGNTCRSPLAAAMLAARVASDPALASIRVTSAGTSAWEGSPASEGSYLVALERGLDLGDHRATLLTRELVHQADRIVTMTAAHVHRVNDLGGAGKAVPISEYAGLPGHQNDVPDPFGGDVGEYRAAAEMLEQLMDPVAERLRQELQR